MVNVQDQLFGIIRASLWSGETVQDSISDDVLFELRAQSVDGLGSSVISQLANDRYNRVAQFVQMVHAQNEAIRILRNAQIPAVVLKGTASGIYYPQPYLRIYGDIDILVQPMNYQYAIQLLSDNSFKLNGDIGKIETSLFRDGFVIELHKSIPGLDRVPEGKAIYSYIMEGFDKIEKGSIKNPKCEFPMLPWKQNGLELIWHIREHLYNGLGLRQIIDWMMFVDRCLKPTERYEEFRIVLDQSGLTKLAKIVTRMCQMYLGLDSRISWCNDADDDLCTQLMEFVIEQGNFGRKKKDEKVIRALTRYGSPSAFIMKLQEEGLSLWPASKQNRLLHPFAWLYAGIKSFRHYLSISSQKELINNIRESRNRQEMFDQIYGPDYGRRMRKSKTKKPFKEQIRSLYELVVNSPLRIPLYHLENYYYNTQYLFYGKPNVSDSDRNNVEQNVTFIFKSFNRHKLAAKCYRCIKTYYPKARVIIADDSEQPLVINDLSNEDTLIHLPFNSGLSKGLIAALELVNTPYTMLLDDDELLTPETKVHEQLSYLQRNHCVDLVGFQPDHLHPEQSSIRYSGVRMNKKLLIPSGTIIDGKEVVYKSANVFLVRTGSYRKIGYDPNIRIIIHHEFFYRAAGEIVCVQDPHCYILHCHNHFIGKKYSCYRQDYQGDAWYIASKHGENYYK